MPKYEFNQLKERYDSIPDDVQRAISSLEVANSLQEIGLKHNLHIDKVAVLAEKVGFVMLGLLPPSKFANTVASEIGITVDEANLITEEINQEIFLPIRESLHQMHGEGGGPQETKPTLAFTPTFFDQKMKRLFTTTTDLKNEPESTPLKNETADGVLHTATPTPNPIATEIKPAGLDPYREGLE